MISIKNLTKIYNKKKEVFNNFNYDITNNLFLLIGPNGAGKTTLLNCVTDYIRFTGEIKVSGAISYLPEFRGFDDDVLSKDLIALIKGMYGTKAEEYIHRFGFKQYLKTKINDLSKGNRTKLFIICTLLKPADIYIFDEPTDGLDLQSKSDFINSCISLSKNKMVLISTHDMGVIDRLRQHSQILTLGEVKNV